MDPNKETVEQMRFLDPSAKEFLSQLDDDDVKLLREVLRMVKAALTIGKFFKWFLVTMLGLWFGGVMLWESILKALGFFKGTPHP